MALFHLSMIVALVWHEIMDKLWQDWRDASPPILLSEVHLGRCCSVAVQPQLVSARPTPCQWLVRAWWVR